MQSPDSRFDIGSEAALVRLFEAPKEASLVSDLWHAERHVVRGSLPTPGKVLNDATAGRIDGGAYDRDLPARVKSTLY